MANVFEIRQNIPIGATKSVIDNTFIMTELKSLKNLPAFFFVIEIALPSKIAKKITCSIFPFTNDSNGLFGIIPKKTSLSDGASEISNYRSRILN